MHIFQQEIQSEKYFYTFEFLEQNVIISKD